MRRSYERFDAYARMMPILTIACRLTARQVPRPAMSHYVDRRHPGLPRRIPAAARRDRLRPGARPAVAGRRPRQPRPGFARRAARRSSALGHAAVTVLGNHDFHLLTVAAGHRGAHRQDTLGDILDGAGPGRAARPGCERGRWSCVEGDLLLVHAGLLPPWTPATARDAVARKSRPCSRSTGARRFPAPPLRRRARALGRHRLTGYDRLRVIVNACTRLRFCAADDTMEFSEKRGIEHTPEGFAPWFSHAERKSARRHDPLRTLVDARPDAHAQRADARLGLPVGRHADRDQARRSPPVSGAGPLVAPKPLG